MNKYKAVTRIFSILLFVTLILCIISLVFLCIYGSDPSIFESKNDQQLNSNLTKLEETFDYGDGYLKGIIFICDKTLSPLSDFVDTVNRDQIWTGADGTLALDRALSSASVSTDGEADPVSIPILIERTKPQYVIISVGLDNGVNHCTEEKFKEYYSNLVLNIKNASPDTKIILQSVFPISHSAEKNDPSISNERIDRANLYIAELAQSLSVRYLNTSSALKGEDGRLDPKFDSGDGIILNEEGYNAVATYIKTHGYK